MATKTAMKKRKVTPKPLPGSVKDERFEVRRVKGKGFGMFAVTPVKKGDFVMEYTGTKIQTKVADTLGTKYLFEIDKEWTIDGSLRSNTARYINHACKPNCEADIRDGHIMLYAVRAIAPGDELSFDYGKEYFDEFITKEKCGCETCVMRRATRAATKTA
jgi:SET domain-containing protein